MGIATITLNLHAAVLHCVYLLGPSLFRDMTAQPPNNVVRQETERYLLDEKLNTKEDILSAYFGKYDQEDLHVTFEAEVQTALVEIPDKSMVYQTVTDFAKEHARRLEQHQSMLQKIMDERKPDLERTLLNHVLKQLNAEVLADKSSGLGHASGFITNLRERLGQTRADLHEYCTARHTEYMKANQSKPKYQDEFQSESAKRRLWGGNPSRDAFIALIETSLNNALSEAKGKAAIELLDALLSLLANLEKQVAEFNTLLIDRGASISTRFREKEHELRRRELFLPSCYGLN
jgi:hypothetical protein